VPSRACLVRNAQWLDSIADGGYATPSLCSRWLPRARAKAWNAPGYWRRVDGPGSVHARWASIRRPAGPGIPCELLRGDAFGAGPQELRQQRSGKSARLVSSSRRAFGIVCRWTRSAYSGLFRVSPAAGALGEYNGKSGQPDECCADLATRRRSHARAMLPELLYPPARCSFAGCGADYRDR